MRQVQLAKRVGETINYLFDFRSSLAAGETLTTLSAVSRVESGVDATPAAILNGSPANAAGVVTQSIKAGVPGVLYSVTVSATTSLAQILHTESIIAILPEPTVPGATAGEQLFPTTITDTGLAESIIDSQVQFNTDGTHFRLTNVGALVVLPNWFLPTTVGVGAGYYIRVTTVSGPWGTSLNYSNGTMGSLNVWRNMNINRFFNVDSSAISGHYVGVLLIEISPSPVGPSTVSANYTFDLTVS